MSRYLFIPVIISLMLFVTYSDGLAITVNPDGVNVNQAGPTTVFLTFRGLSNQRPVEALWCGAINPDQSCVAGTIFGRLPLRSDLSTSSGTNNFTDIMTIPYSVARRAYQDALRGNTSQFFYVRRFASTTGGPDEFVAVTCRMAGRGARLPLALMDVRLRFKGVDRQQPVLLVQRSEAPPPFGAEIQYNGSGRLKGRWEVLQPGDPEPSDRDLLPEGSLPVEERALQRRYTLLGRFDIFLPPTGKTFLPGPDPRKVPTAAGGAYKILLRVEATDDKEANSDTGAGVVHSGGVAGFSLPVLRYYVGTLGEAQQSGVHGPDQLQLMLPGHDALIPANQTLDFSWIDLAGEVLYKLEITSAQGPIFSAVVKGGKERFPEGIASYTAPPWLREHTGVALRWRVVVLGPDGSATTTSVWRPFRVES